MLTMLVALTLGLLAVLRAAEAQPSAKVARIGYLSPAGGAGSPLAEAFQQGLRELGYVEGHNIALEFRAATRGEQLPGLAAELVQLPVDVLVAHSSAAAQAAKNTTTSIPIVMISSGDPVATGLVASLARPGGNITGVTGLATELVENGWSCSARRCPASRAWPCCGIRADAAMTLTSTEIQAAARALGMTVQPLGVREAHDIDSAIAAMTAERPDALFMITDVLTRPHTQQTVDLAAQRQPQPCSKAAAPSSRGA